MHLILPFQTQFILSLTSFWTHIVHVPYNIFNMVIYVSLTVLKKRGNIFLFSYHLRSLIFFVDEVEKLLIMPNWYFFKVHKYIISQKQICFGTGPDPEGGPPPSHPLVTFFLTM